MALSGAVRGLLFHKGMEQVQIKSTIFLFVIALSLVAGCAGDGRGHAGAQSGDAETNAGAEPAHAPSATDEAASIPDAQLSDPLRGTVKETMDSGGYTYLLVAADRIEVWAAARKFAVAVGDEVELAGLQLMRNFRSPSLGRVFEEIQFVGLAKVIGDGDSAKNADTQASNGGLPPGHPRLTADGEVPGAAQVQPPSRDLPQGHPSLAGDAATTRSNPFAGSEVSRIDKLADGITVAELFAKKESLAGKIVKFRGQVVKASRMILGSNWLHVRDGTGEVGSNDITVTSKKDFATVGSYVVIVGTLGVDKDFGAGYSYDVIVEDATVVADTGHQDEKGPGPEKVKETSASGTEADDTP